MAGLLRVGIFSICFRWKPPAAGRTVVGLAVLGLFLSAGGAFRVAAAAELPAATTLAARLDPWLVHLGTAGAAPSAAGPDERPRLPSSESQPALLHVDEALLEMGRVRVQLDTGPAGGLASALRPVWESALPSLAWEYDSGHLAQVVIDIAQLPALAQLPGLFYALRPPTGVALPMPGGGGGDGLGRTGGAWPTAGSIVSAGVAESGADVYHASGYRGEGLLVGVLDICFEGATHDIGTELPADTKVRTFGHCTATPSDPSRYHGTACAQIVHDVAPAAGLRLANATTLLEMEAAIRWLREEGVSVITHSVGWFWGPGDGTGDIADIVHEEAVDHGIVWVNAAGNQGQRYWGGPFRDENANGVHEFDAGGDEDLTFLGVQNNTTLRFLLTWDRWPYSPDLSFEVDIFLDGTRIATSADASNPSVYAHRDISARTTKAGTVTVVIRRSKGTEGAWLRLHQLDDSGYNLAEHRTPQGSLILPADSPRVLSVGAYRREGARAVLEDFSSRGPTLAGVLKPELCGLDGVRTSWLETFQGTSAAAPLVAGITALLIQAAPDGGFFNFRWTMAELFELLAWSAEPPGFSEADGCVWGLAHLPPAQQRDRAEDLLRVGSPARGDVRLAFGRTVPGPAHLTAYDLAGRRVGAEISIDRPERGASLLWPARDFAGRPLPAGLYVLAVRGPGWGARRSILLLP